MADWDDDPTRCIYCGAPLRTADMNRGSCRWCNGEMAEKRRQARLAEKGLGSGTPTWTPSHS